MTIVLERPGGIVHIDQLKTGKSKITVELRNKNLFMPLGAWDTAYPPELIEAILNSKGVGYLCDEIRRDEDPGYVQRSVEYSILSYINPESFDGKRLIDFGCGSGASTVVLARMFPNASEIVGVDFLEDYLSIARLRANHYGFDNLTFLRSPDESSLPGGIGDFDYVVLSAVFEHFLPEERTNLLPKVWSLLKPGGILFLDQTPHRYFPVESHTTGLPLINYLPDNLALQAARRLSKRKLSAESWESLLRRGIRGGTVKEVLGILANTSHQPVLLDPGRMGMKDRLDLWYQRSAAARFPLIKRLILLSMKALRAISGKTLVPSLSLAIKKSG